MGAVSGYGDAGEATVLADRDDATVVRLGDVVAKAHAPVEGPREAEALAARVRLATDAHLAGILLPPLTAEVGTLPGGRPVSLWPYGAPVAPERPEDAPWEAAGTLLARLHAIPVTSLHAIPVTRTAGLSPVTAAGHRPPLSPIPPISPIPPMRGPAKAARAVDRLRAALRERGEAGGAHPAEPPADAVAGPGTGDATPSRLGPAEEPAASRTVDVIFGMREVAHRAPTHHVAAHRAAAASVLRAWGTLPAWARGEADSPRADALCHGDLHLGQLVRHPAPEGPWLLIDVDDMGLGEPAWDLARPAAWYATGLLDPADWARFLGAYRAAGGRAVPPEGDPWAELDAPARALTVQTAATALLKAMAADRPLDGVEEALVEACTRMSALAEAVG
ncbi:aminoglycoside phosphotransferase family protein [Streptomyces sp. LX-29]|nr:phosphotransferase [Streptomyces sp. LX-29]WFB11485.1 aminoglycoside phosphotransferase family protein [Streptomyces sp. LX-29]